MPSFSKTSVTFSVTSTGSFCMAGFPMSSVDLARQFLSKQQTRQFETQLVFTGIREPCLQPCPSQQARGGVELRQHIHLARGACLPPQPDLQGFHFGVGVGK